MTDHLESLISRFSQALLEKLRAAEQKYGRKDDWLDPNWETDCQRQLLEHVAKGDPRDVAAYAAFCWHHGWKTRTGDDAQSAGMRDALEFYANSKRYEGANTSPLPDDPFQPQELFYRLDVTRDGGRIARKALAAQPPAAPVETEEANYDRASSTAVAWIAFADDGKVRFWTSDERRAGDEKAKGLNLRAFTLAELVSLVSKLPHPGSSAGSEPVASKCCDITASVLCAGCPRSTAPQDLERMREVLQGAQRIIERDFPNGQLAIDIRNVLTATEPQPAPVLDFFSQNVDAWGAAEWFDRMAKAIREQDAAVVAGDRMTMEMCQNVAASSAMHLVRDYEQQVRAALSLPRPDAPQAVSVAVDTTDYTELRASLADNITLFSHHKAALLRLVDAKIASTLSRPHGGRDHE